MSQVILLTLTIGNHHIKANRLLCAADVVWCPVFIQGAWWSTVNGLCGNKFKTLCWSQSNWMCFWLSCKTLHGNCFCYDILMLSISFVPRCLACANNSFGVCFFFPFAPYGMVFPLFFLAKFKAYFGLRQQPAPAISEMLGGKYFRADHVTKLHSKLAGLPYFPFSL